MGTLPESPAPPESPSSTSPGTRRTRRDGSGRNPLVQPEEGDGSESEETPPPSPFMSVPQKKASTDRSSRERRTRCSSHVRPSMQHCKRGSVFPTLGSFSVYGITHTHTHTHLLYPHIPGGPAAFIKTTNPDTCFNTFWHVSSDFHAF